jgi:hypothetical protein
MSNVKPMNEKKIESGSVGFVKMHSYYRERSCAKRKSQCSYGNSASYFDKYWDCGVQQSGVPLLHDTPTLPYSLLLFAWQARQGTADVTVFTEIRQQYPSVFSVVLFISNTLSFPDTQKRMVVFQTSIPLV